MTTLDEGLNETRRAALRYLTLRLIADAPTLLDALEHGRSVDWGYEFNLRTYDFHFILR